MSARLFISYRRADSRDAAGRLRDRLAAAFGDENIVFDVDSIDFGVDFRIKIRETLQSVDAVIVLIGPNFDLRRLSEPTDSVRLELSEAFAQKKRLIPVLVADARMPASADLPVELQPLSYLNAAHLRPDPDFRPDATRLIESLERALGPPSAMTDPPRKTDSPSNNEPQRVEPDSRAARYKLDPECEFAREHLARFERRLLAAEFDCQPNVRHKEYLLPLVATGFTEVLWVTPRLLGRNRRTTTKSRVSFIVAAAPILNYTVLTGLEGCYDSYHFPGDTSFSSDRWIRTTYPWYGVLIVDRIDPTISGSRTRPSAARSPWLQRVRGSGRLVVVNVGARQVSLYPSLIAGIKSHLPRFIEALLAFPS